MRTTTTIGRVTNTAGARIHLAIDSHRALCGSGAGTITRPVPQHNIQHVQAKNLCRRCFRTANLDHAQAVASAASTLAATAEVQALTILRDLIATPEERARRDAFVEDLKQFHASTDTDDIYWAARGMTKPQPEPVEYRPRDWAELRAAFADGDRRYRDMLRARRTGQQAELLAV